MMVLVFKQPLTAAEIKAKARALAKAICSLAPLRHLSLHCHLNVAGGYQLAFSNKGRHLPAVTVEAPEMDRVGGTCRTLTACVPEAL